jgi:hypothetical protein
MNTFSNQDYLIYCIGKNSGLIIGKDSGGFVSYGPATAEAIAGEHWVKVHYPSATRIPTMHTFWAIANKRCKDYMEGKSHA